MKTSCENHREQVLHIIASLKNQGKSASFERIGQHITAGEIGLMLRLLPAEAREVILSHSAEDLREIVGRIAEGQKGPGPQPSLCCASSPFAPYVADTPEKALQKYVDIFEGLKLKREI